MTTEALRSPAEVIAESLNGLMNDPATVYAHITKHWQPDDIKNFCNRLAGVDIPVLRLELSNANTAFAMLHDEHRRLLADCAQGEAKLARLMDDHQLLEKSYDAKAQAVKSLSAVNLSHRETIADLTAKLEHRNIPEEVRDLADYLSSIVPDRRCTVPGCYGKRGYRGFSIGQDKEGKRKVVVDLCCGKVGQSEYTRIVTELKRLYFIESEILRLTSQVFRFLSLWNVWNWWRIIKAKLGKKNAEQVNTPIQGQEAGAPEDTGRKEVQPLSLALGGRKKL